MEFARGFGGKGRRAIVLVAWVTGGCVASGGEPSPTDSVVTYYGEVAGILQERCQACHRPGGGAPFSLTTYEDAFRYREMVSEAVEMRRMPPWGANPDIGVWDNDRSLSEGERTALLTWVRQGAVEGDGSEGPPERTWSEGWRIGSPDAVVSLPDPVAVPATGVVPYVYRYLETDFAEDRWIQAMEIRPSVPEVVHHIMVLPIDPQERVSADGDVPHGMGDGLEGYFAVTGPGHQGVRYPPGQAKLLPRGAALRLQLHYTPNGVATEDRPEIGFIFAREPPEYMVETGAVVNTGFVIRPEASGQEVTAVHRFAEPIRIIGFLPHMHLRGEAFRFELHQPDGLRETLLDIPRFNFHWQDEYILATPVNVPAGSWLRATGWFDNSAKNPLNPDPTAVVRFGEQTYEEMMNGFFHYLVRNPNWEGSP